MTERSADERLMPALRDSGHSISWLAKQTGFTYMHVWRVVNGRANGSEGFLRLCAVKLGLPDEAFLDPTEAVA